ncbi:MAG: ATP-binding protein, partial [Chitinophagales bacterium]
MNTNATLQQLKDLKLAGMARSYESVLQLPTHKQPEGHTLVAQLCDAESQNRIHYKTQFYLKISKLRYAAMLEEISFTKDRNLKPEQISTLADCSFIDRAENILISGSTGSGKSFLACAFGHQACVMGYKTLYLNMNRFTEKLMMAKLGGTFVKLLNQLEKTSLLILDDFGLAPMDQNT